MRNNQILLIIISLFTGIFSSQTYPLFTDCQGTMKEAVKTQLNKITSSEDFSGLTPKILLEMQSELESAMETCVNDSCWDSGKEACEKSTLQTCIKNGDFWMAQCPQGFKPKPNSTSCIQVCPQGFTDSDNSCMKPSAYSRGVGFTWTQGDQPFSLIESQLRCGKKFADVGCELCGSIVYPKCKPNFVAVSCNICESVCPEGMMDEIKSCKKQVQGPETRNSEKQQSYKSGICFEENWIKNPVLINEEECSTQPDLLLSSIQDLYSSQKKSKQVDLKSVHSFISQIEGFLIYCSNNDINLQSY